MTDSVRLCELEASVSACGSGVNIGIVQFEALLGRKWCEERAEEHSKETHWKRAPRR